MPFPPGATRRMLMIVGPPAAGKSTLMRALTSRWAPWPRPQADPPHVLYLDAAQRTQALELGTLREGHPGTDALPMTVITSAVRWLALDAAPLVLLEGARLAVPRWVTAAGSHGFHILVALLDTDDEELDRRCAARGTNQSLPWRRGTATRARNLHAWAADMPYCGTLRLDAAQPTATLSAQLWKEIQ
jgi:hypothetical protein